MTLELKTPREIASFLGISVATLAVWRTNKTYPLPYTKVGGRIRYKVEDVQKWLDSRQYNTLKGDNNE